MFLDGATTAITTWTGTYDDDQLGAAVAVVPDIDGDGDDEAAVGAPSGGLAGRAPGWTYLFTEHDAASADWETFGGRDEDHLGLALLGGDFTGDGYGDLLVGSKGYVSESAVQLFASSAGALGTVTDGEIDEADSVGLSPAGDIDSDGDDDFFAVYDYTDIDDGELHQSAVLCAGDASGIDAVTSVGADTPVAAAWLGDIYGSGLPAVATGESGAVLLQLAESDGDGVPAELLGDWDDCDDSDATRNPVTVETDGDGIDSDCDGSDDVSVRAEEACPDLLGDPAAVLDWVAALESGALIDNQATVLSVLDEAHAAGCASTRPSDAASVEASAEAVVDCDATGTRGFASSEGGHTTWAVTLERDSGDTAEPAAIDGWVRDEGSTTESGGWVRWQDGTVEPVRAATSEYKYESSDDGWIDEYYRAVLPLADCDVTVARELDQYWETYIETLTVTSDSDWWVYENSYSQPIDCGYPESWDFGTRVTTPAGSTWYTSSSLTTPYPDADADGWPVEFGDCDDADARRYPCAEEDGVDDVDDDCNGSPDRDVDGDGVLEQYDSDDADATVGRPETWYTDADGDTWGNAAVEYCPGDTGVVERYGDCDDTNAEIHPGVTEVCDGLDNDCDSRADDYAADALLLYLDDDGDGYGMMSGREQCPESGYIELTGDCDDHDATINPRAPETYNNGIDENCDGLDAISLDVTAAEGPPPDHSGTRGCLGSFALLLFPSLALARRRR